MSILDFESIIYELKSPFAPCSRKNHLVAKHEKLKHDTEKLKWKRAK